VEGLEPPTSCGPLASKLAREPSADHPGSDYHYTTAATGAILLITLHLKQIHIALLQMESVYIIVTIILRLHLLDQIVCKFYDDFTHQ